MVGCLLVLGVDAVAGVVEDDGYYWDHAVGRLGCVLGGGRKEA